jgi:hypothetical protein
MTDASFQFLCEREVARKCLTLTTIKEDQYNHSPDFSRKDDLMRREKNGILFYLKCCVNIYFMSTKFFAFSLMIFSQLAFLILQRHELYSKRFYNDNFLFIIS